MGKDPAFLFYPGDWLGGVMTFSRSHKGAYMDLLMCQFNNGHMSLQDIKTVLGSDFPMWDEKLKGKFRQDDNGLFFNEKLENEATKRKKFTQSRKENLRHKDNHTVTRMENVNENKDCIENNEKKSNFENEWFLAFDEITIERFQMHYRPLGLNIDELLKDFRLKCDNDKQTYYSRSSSTLRTNFQYHLDHARKATGGQQVNGLSLGERKAQERKAKGL